MATGSPAGTAVFSQIQVAGHGLAGNFSGERVIQMLAAGWEHAAEFHSIAVDRAAQVTFESPALMRSGDLFALDRQEQLVPRRPYFILHIDIPASGEIDGGRRTGRLAGRFRRIAENFIEP